MIWKRTRRIARVTLCAASVLMPLAACAAAHSASASDDESDATISERDLAARPSIDLVVRYAVQRNPAIRAARREWEAARERIPQERSYENPLITYSPDTGNMAETRAGPQRNGVAFSQAIPFPGKLTLRGRIAADQAQAIYQRLQATIQEVSRQTRAWYAEYYLADRSLETNGDTTELVRQAAAIADQKYRVGTAAQQDVILAQEQLSRLAAERVVFDGDRDTALGTLNALLDRPPRAAVAEPGELAVREIPIALDDLVGRAGAARPELKSQDHLVEASHRSLTLAKMGYLPDFRVGAQYVAVEGGTNPTFARDGHDIWTATIGFSIPIWIDRVQAGVHEHRARALQQELVRRDLANRVYDQVQRAYERVRVAARTEKIYRTTLVPQTQERIAAARAGYETGLVDFLTLIDSLKSLEEVQLERYRAVRDFHQAAADLERAVGQPVAGVEERQGEQP
jgi:cobalt-zinc-cadmium efflux system outer membrane protein